MLKISRLIILRSIQVRVCHSNKSLDNVVTVQNVHEKNSYRFEPNMKLILNTLRTLLSCTERKAYSIWDQYPSIRSDDMTDRVGNNIEILMKHGISSESILENPFLIVMNKDDLQTILEILLNFNLSKKMINDFVPLLQIDEPYLRQIFELFTHEQSQIPCENRIYYFSRKLNIKPSIVAKYCAKNEYLLTAPFEKVDRKVQILLDYNIKPMSILSNLYTLDRCETIYVTRLERLKLALLHAKDVKMWLFKCADEVFEKHLEELHHTKCDLAMDKIKPKCDRKIQIENELNEMLECDDDEAAHIYYSQINRFDQIDSAKQNIDFLQSKGVSLEKIAENPVILAMSLDQLQSNFETLIEMDPKYIDDILPLISVQKAQLDQYKIHLKEQTPNRSFENPIYYFSEKLKVSPSKVSSYFAKNPERFLRSSEKLQQKLDILVAYGVEPNSILNAPATFRISLSNLEKRLTELKAASFEPIYSWMLTCSPSELKKLIHKQNIKKEILDDCNSTIEYIAKRLNWDKKTKENVVKSYPSIAKCNVTKAKKLIDYLLNETHFTENDISSYPRVFSNSLETLENRMKELLSVELKPQRLYIICLDRKTYLKFIEKHCCRLNNKRIWSNFQKIETKIKQNHK